MKLISHGAEVEMDFAHVECTDDKVVPALFRVCKDKEQLRTNLGSKI